MCSLEFEILTEKDMIKDSLLILSLKECLWKIIVLSDQWPGYRRLWKCPWGQELEKALFLRDVCDR